MRKTARFSLAISFATGQPFAATLHRAACYQRQKSAIFALYLFETYNNSALLL
jgi:hypothetical protein